MTRTPPDEAPDEERAPEGRSAGFHAGKLAPIVLAVGLAAVVLLVLVGTVGTAADAGWAGGAFGWAFLIALWTSMVWLRFLRTSVNPFRFLSRAATGTGPAGWLASATAVDEGVLLPASPPGQACDLVIGPKGVTVSAGWASATLEWQTWREWPGPPLLRGAGAERAQHRDTWSVAPLGAEEAVGVGIELTGRYVEDTMLVRKQRSTWWDKLTRRGAPGVRLPLVARWGPDPQLDAERDTVATLCRLLAQRPELRARMGDPRRTRRLVDDLARATPGTFPDSDPISRRRFEIAASLKRLGFVHRLGGRPLPGTPLTPRTEVVDRVAAELGRSPYTRDLFIDPAQIREMVDERYLVEPWPFGALLD